MPLKPFISAILAISVPKHLKREALNTTLSYFILRGKMTKINKIVMHGFKSFAKRTELLFGNDFNCVLGPNGSGKSNILDALCFVLGKGSAKGLRAEKSANLIYNGGKTKKPAKSAEVSIYFDNHNKIFPTEEHEVKITRILRPSGQSTYKINDHTRTRTQILELLSLAKIDPDGYNIILQGDIVRLIDMTPVERRQIIEEISGISVYEDKKQKAVKELDKVEGRLKEAELILQERDARLKELKKERDQAQKFKDLDSRIKTNKATHLHRQMEAKIAEKEELDERLDKHKEKQDSLNKSSEELRADIGKTKEAIEKINQEIEKRGEKEQIMLHKEIEKYKIDLATSKNRIENCKDEIAKIKNRKDNLKENLKETEVRIKDVTNQKKEFESQRSNAEKELALVNRKIEEFRKKHKLDGISEIEKQVDDSDKLSEDIQKEIQDMRQNQQDLLREKDRLEFKIQSIDEKITKVLELEKEHKDQIRQLKQNKAEFKKATLELNQILNRNSEISAQLGEYRRKLIETNEELSKLRARQLTIGERLGSNEALKSILNLKASNKMRGIFGTVSELGETNKRYSLALEIAAGPKIKSVVVENDKVAADCIGYLKKNKLGIATFLPLNKIRSKPEDQNTEKFKNSPGVHGKAVDLVSYDPKFKNIFSYVFENTLVVDSLETARKIGVGNVKMVTLDGDLTALSGAMQGGFRMQREGLGFGEKEVTKAISEFEGISADLGMKISKLEREKNSDEEKIVTLREFKANLEGEIIKVEKSLHLDEGDVDVNKKEKQNIRDELVKIDKKLQEVQNDIGSRTKQLVDIKIKKQQLRTKISELRNPTLLAELNAFEEKKTALRENMIKIDSEIKNFIAQIDSMLLPEHENIQKILKQHDKEVEVFNKEMVELNENIKIKESELKVKEKKESEFYAQFKDLFQQRTRLGDIVGKKEGKVFVLNEDIRKTEHKINSINLELAKIETILDALKEDFREFEGVEIDKEKTDMQLVREINTFERMVENLGAVNMRALEIFEDVANEYRDLMQKKTKLFSEKEDVMKLMEEIEAKKKVLFNKTFEVLNTNFQNLFGSLTTKGEATLELENPEAPFEAGLNIKVRIAGTKFLDIRSLSGGEKTLTALAFLFSVQEHEPASFYVLDEVDAALDKKNSEKLAMLIKQYSDKAQYLIISHNDGVISEATTLYGVSMNEHGMSDVVTLRI